MTGAEKSGGYFKPEHEEHKCVKTSPKADYRGTGAEYRNSVTVCSLYRSPLSTASTSLSMASSIIRGQMKNWAHLEQKHKLSSVQCHWYVMKMMTNNIQGQLSASNHQPTEKNIYKWKSGEPEKVEKGIKTCAEITSMITDQWINKTFIKKYLK